MDHSSKLLWLVSYGKCKYCIYDLEKALVASEAHTTDTGNLTQITHEDK